MADEKVKINHIASCDLGKIGSSGVALRITFAMDADKVQSGPYHRAVFALSTNAARGLATALTSLLEEETKSARN